MELVGRVAIVTGAAKRLGRAMALELARAGLKVCVHYCHSATDAESICREIRLLGSEAIAVQCDFAQPNANLEQLVETSFATWGRVDVLVNSASVFEPATLQSTTTQQFDHHIAVNLRAPWLLSQAFVRRLSRDQQGHIVNIVDWRALRPVPGHFTYTLTKAALWAMTRLLAQELAPQVRVNAIAPGAILPPPGADSSYLDQLKSQIPLARTGNVSDVTEALLFLLRSEFVTGCVLPVTGGQEL